MRTILAAALMFLAWAAAALAQTPAPDGLRVEPAAPPDGCTTLILHWNPVPGALGYEILEFRAGDWRFDEDDANRIPMTASTVITGLEPGTPYEFRVRAIGVDGPSAPSDAAGGRTLPAGTRIAPSDPQPPSRPEPRTRVDAPPPEAPTSVIGVFSDSDRVQLSWRKVPGAAYYRVQEEKDGQWVEVPGEEGRTTDNRVVLLNHPRPGPFRFRVFAVGENGRSSEPSFAVTVVRD